MISHCDCNEPRKCSKGIGTKSGVNLQGNPLFIHDFHPDYHFNIVGSNPPYISRADLKTLAEEVIKFESSDAFCGDDDGLDSIGVKLACVGWKWTLLIQKPLRSGLRASPQLRVGFDSTHIDMFGKEEISIDKLGELVWPYQNHLSGSDILDSPWQGAPNLFSLNASMSWR